MVMVVGHHVARETWEVRHEATSWRQTLSNCMHMKCESERFRTHTDVLYIVNYV